MRKYRISLALLLTFLLVNIGGCAHQAMDHAIHSWQNQPVAAVITAWGRPSEELRVNGKHLLLWNTADSVTVLPAEKGAGQRSGPIGCVRLLEADKSGRIIAGTWDGNDCPGWFSGWYR